MRAIIGLLAFGVVLVAANVDISAVDNLFMADNGTRLQTAVSAFLDSNGFNMTSVQLNAPGSVSILFTQASSMQSAPGSTPYQLSGWVYESDIGTYLSQSNFTQVQLLVPKLILQYDGSLPMQQTELAGVILPVIIVAFFVVVFCFRTIIKNQYTSACAHVSTSFVHYFCFFVAFSSFVMLVAAAGCPRWVVFGGGVQSGYMSSWATCVGIECVNHDTEGFALPGRTSVTLVRVTAVLAAVFNFIGTLIILLIEEKKVTAKRTGGIAYWALIFSLVAAFLAMAVWAAWVNDVLVPLSVQMNMPVDFSMGFYFCVSGFVTSLATSFVTYGIILKEETGDSEQVLGVKSPPPEREDDDNHHHSNNAHHNDNEVFEGKGLPKMKSDESDEDDDGGNGGEGNNHHHYEKGGDVAVEMAERKYSGNDVGGVGVGGGGGVDSHPVNGGGNRLSQRRDYDDEDDDNDDNQRIDQHHIDGPRGLGHFN